MTEHPEWYDDEWCVLLRRRVAELGTRRVSELIGYSPATVHTCVNGTYAADPGRVARRVIERLGGRTVECPVLGDLLLAKCAEHRAAPFAATNPVRVRLYRTCPTCPNNPDRHKAEE